MGDTYDLDSSSDSSSDEETTFPDTRKGSKKLREKLTNRFQWSAFEKTSNKFVANGVVEELVNEQAIKSSLVIKDRTPTLEEDDLIKFILKHARKAFAIAVLAQVNTHVAMRWLKSNGYNDERLPIRQEDKPWNSSWRRDFLDKQWTILAPTFSSDFGHLNPAPLPTAPVQTHELEEAHILPFTEKLAETGEGSFGQVTKYVVHKDHMIPTLTEHTAYAVKFLKGENMNAQDVAEDWRREVKALRTMNKLNQEHIVRFVSAFRRRKRDRTQEHYLMFEWADNGNLRDLWRTTHTRKLSSSLVRDVITQILGLATALQAAHNLNQTEASYRHGDLKPENILCFKGEGQIGTLKIGDWGEAKFHEEDQVTEMRPSRTSAKHGTRRYEAPEVETGVQVQWLGQSRKRRSRLNDIWAMGCITLECMVWLLYGPDGLNQFGNDVGKESFYQWDIENGKPVAWVHPAAVRWMDTMAQDPACSVGTTALGDLLEVIRTALLVVKLPKRLGTGLSEPDAVKRRADSGVGTSTMRDEAAAAVNQDDDHISSDDEATTAKHLPTFVFTGPDDGGESEPMGESDRIPVPREAEAEGPARCLSREFKNRMEHIVYEDENPGYWDTHEENIREVPAHLASSSFIARRPSRSKIDYEPPDLNENDWKRQLNNEYAFDMFNTMPLDERPTQPFMHGSSDLCETCQTAVTRLWEIDFEITYDAAALAASAAKPACQLCALILQTYSRHCKAKSKDVRVERIGHVLKINSNRDAILPIVRHPSMDSFSATDYQVGLVNLPDAGSPTHMQIIRHWLKDCDERHKEPQVQCRNTTYSELPTRLLDVGSGDGSIIYLREGDKLPDLAAQWVALSHQWGNSSYCTTRSNLREHANGFAFEDLPNTFKDAVKVTRALGKRYLWIDSLCVVQGKDGDFQDEAKRMENVYSGAYCVIAASCATDHYSGFLKTRKSRNHVNFVSQKEDNAPFFICENIDNFKAHVLDGTLNSRGWVLQEHALARRTIFFTEHQTYFECGCGVQCETSTKLSNGSAAFLGDPEFPRLLYQASQGGKILRIQGLFSKYSRLGLSKPYDRPVAIAGLQERLLSTIRVTGDFGILDGRDTKGLLRRTLSWHRSLQATSLRPIDFSQSQAMVKVPSWSWMAYKGGIDYLQLDFDQWLWSHLQSPWNGEHEDKIAEVDPSAAHLTLVAHAQRSDFNAATEYEVQCHLDDREQVLVGRPLCVVLGKAKGTDKQDEQKHCVLIISSTMNRDSLGNIIYERKGVAILPGKCISPPQTSKIVHIQ